MMHDATRQEVLTADDKARLIHEALATLRAADGIDEHVTLTPSEWLAWRDAVLPTVRDIEVLAAAMRLKLSVERGKRPGPRRGGDQTSRSNLTKLVRSPDAEYTRRWRDRQLATHEDTVNNYIRTAAAAAQKPTENGALRAIKMTQPVTPGRERMGQEKTTSWAQKILAAVEELGDGIERSSEQIRRILTQHETQRLEEFLRTVHFLPWFAVRRTGEQYRFTIDRNLRAICDGLAPRPELPNSQSIAAFFTTLGEESDRRRKENHCEYRRRRWNPDETIKQDLIKLLDHFHEAVTMIRGLLA